MSDKTIKLPCFGIVVELTDLELHAIKPNCYGGGSITSDLHENPDSSDMKDENDIADYNHAMDGIESLILNHAVAGIDIESPAYIEGIESTVEGCANNF